MAALEAKMILVTGNRRRSSNFDRPVEPSSGIPVRKYSALFDWICGQESPRSTQHGFTLIELILVMTLLMIVLAVSAPSLGSFFKGRNLDSEARRIYSLT